MSKSKNNTISREITHEEAEACASEQVQFIGSVQPHGFLIVVDNKTNKLIQYSSNIFRLLNAKKMLIPKDLKLLDTYLDDWVKTSDLNVDGYLRENRLSLLDFTHGGYISPDDWECLIASYKSYYTLEFIPKLNYSKRYKLISDLSDSLNYIDACESETVLFDKITEVFQKITKYDRVMMYKFHPDWSGEVISESVSKNNSKKYLGLRFPSEDIPRSARELYTKSPIRLMADVDSIPEKLIPEKLSDGFNIDLSISVLRGMSRMHIKYLKNMGVKASLSVSLMKKNKLWGLMAFHHNTPKLPPNSLIPELLAACELLGDVVSVILYPKLEINNLSSQTKKIQTIDKCFNKINLLANNSDQLEGVFDSLFSGFKQDVIGFSLDKNIYIKSESNKVQPKQGFQKKIGNLFSEENLNLYKNTVLDARESPFLATKPAKVCGILAIKSTKVRGLVVFFGRFELERDINWGGKPGTVNIVVKNGVRELEPRSSFALWRQKTHGISKDWDEYDIELIKKLTSYTENFILYQVNEEVKNKLYRNSYTDFLTNIPNRRYIEEYFQKKINCKSVSVLFIDLDDFKKVNDYFGHQYGDILLRQAVDKIKACTDENSIIARLGGDEFFVVLHYDVDIENSIKNSIAVANSIRESIKDPISIGISKVYIDLSIGIFTFDPKKTDYQNVFKCSDIAMYKAKTNGKSSIHVFDDNDEKKMFYELHVEAKIRDSILSNSDELGFVLQPQYDADNNIVGAEALARWSNPELGNVYPETFIKIAEKSQIIEQLGKHIYSNVCKQTADILNASYTNFNQQISINISPKQLFSNNFIEWLLETNKKYKVPINKTCLEITESIFIDNFELASNIIRKLRKHGYLISLDDFGTGFASLSYLIKLPVDELKIDQIFVQNIDKNSESLAMIEGVMALCKKMNFKTVAEGVENENQYKILKDLGCDVFQGYYLGWPLKLSDFKNLLKK